MTLDNIQPSVTVLGGINMDLIGTAPRIPSAGETIRGESFYTAPGGKGANQAVAAARLGAQVRMVGKVGKDVFGPMLIEGLRRDGVDVRFIREDKGHPSGIAMILLDSVKENHIVAIYGANSQCDDLEVSNLKDILSLTNTLLLQLEIPYAVSMKAARAAKDAGVRVIWDPAPATELPNDAYSIMDIITPNQVEAEALTGIPVTDIPSARNAAQLLLNRGVRVAILKLGDLGVYYESGHESGHVPSFPVEVVDTVAAGDAFAGGLAVSLSNSIGLREAIRYGCAAGAIAVTRQGAQESMPSKSEVEDLLLHNNEC